MEMSEDVATVLEGSPVEALEERSKDGKALRWFELALVLLIAFGASLVRSADILLRGRDALNAISSAGWIAQVVEEAGCLLLLAYVLRRRGMRIRDLGLRWSWGSLVSGLLLAVLSYIAYWIGSFVLYELHHALIGGAVSGATAHQIFGKSTIWMLAMDLVNPFFEELIVRAYLMSEVRALTGSWLAAAAISVLVQTAYHLYYGWVGALSVGFTFLVFSVYYARTRRATPLVVAHGVADLVATLALR
jgi:membrane protease YdiL (CAAX protease family)